MEIIITDAATERAKEFLRRSGRVDDNGNLLCGLRLHIKGGDVFGVKYVFSVDCDTPRQSDTVVESHGFKLYLDSDTSAYLSEISEVLRIDHVESPTYSGFRVSFPRKTITLVGEEGPTPEKSGVRLRSPLAAALFIIVLVVGLGAGWMGASMNILPKTMAPSPPATAQVVNIDVIPDWGGPGYDAFVLPSALNGTVPVSTTKASPGMNNNAIFVQANVPVTFVITDTDTAINMNYSETAKLAFTIYNDSSTGQVPVPYAIGQPVNMSVSHTFLISGTNIDVPLPPDTVVTFTTIFTTSGGHVYYCTAPCGPGMGVMGYMDGSLVVH